MKKITLFIVAFICYNTASKAQSAATLQQWANETFSKIEQDFRKTGSNLYKENNNGEAMAYNWPQGIQFHAMIGDENISRAEAMAQEIHSRYWCYKNNRWGYSASADVCGGRYYDDNAWIACGLMELYGLTNNNTYLTWAKEALAFSMSAENPTNVSPGGGIRWSEGDTSGQCNCATAPTILANGLIYNATNESQYLTDGLRLYNWMKANRFDAGGGYRGYENATLVAGALELFKATNNQVYLSDAQHQGLMMESAYVNQQTHALHETGQWGGHDMSAAYRDLYEMDGDVNWLNIATGYLNYLHENCKDAQGRYPENWFDVGVTGAPSLLYQASVARGYAEIGNTPGGYTKYPDPVAIFYHPDYNSYFSTGLWLGEYTAADLAFLGWSDNMLSSLKVAAGYKLTIYKDDNFLGEALELTNDVNNLYNLGWDDVMTSLKIEILDPHAIVYQHCTYDGRSVHLPVGNYNLAELQKRGINNNWISSITLSEGFKVTFYDNDDFSGSGTTLNSTQQCLVNVGGSNYNDIISSIKVRPVGAPNINGTYFLQNVNSGLYMDVNGGVTATGNNIKIIQSSYNGNENQQFELTDRGDGTYSIIAKHSGKAIDVQNGSMDSGALIYQQGYSGAENQHFILIPMGNDNYKLMAEHSGMLAEVSTSNNGEQLHQWWDHGGANAQWKILPAGNLSASNSAASLLSSDANVYKESFSIYPNPVQSVLTIKGTPLVDRVEIYDITGKLIKTTNEREINVINLNKGIYIIKIINLQNTTNKIFIKN